MKIKLRKNYKGFNVISYNKFFLRIILLLSMYSCVAFLKKPILCFFMVILLLVFIVIKAKFSFFSVLVFLIDFCLWQSLIQELTGNTYGLLIYSSLQNEYFLLSNITFYFGIVVYVYLTKTKILEMERKKYLYRFIFSDISIITMLVISLIVTIFIFPSIPGIRLGKQRFNEGILPFSGFEIIPFLFLSMTISALKKNKWIFFVYIFVIGWYIGHGERITALGFIIFLFIIYLSKKNIKFNFLKIIKIGVLLIPIVLVFIWIGIKRTGDEYVISIIDLIKKCVIQPTACDVVHTFNCSVEMSKENGLLYGITYLSYIYELIPGLYDPYLTENVIAKSHVTAGGTLIFNEPLINFGIIGIIIFPIVFMQFIYFLLNKKNSKYWCGVWYVIVIMVFRISWYGLNYPITSIVWILPISLAIFSMLDTLGKRV